MYFYYLDLFFRIEVCFIFGIEDGMFSLYNVLICDFKEGYLGVLIFWDEYIYLDYCL